MENLKLIKPLTWPEVFEIWRSNEENTEHWKQYWKSKGFESWEAWRNHTHANLHGENLAWALYKVENPAETVSRFLGGPFRSWTKWFYMNNPKPSFADIVQHPGIQNHRGILELVDSFPSPTTITGVKTSDGIVVIEGMHRACAIALSVLKNRPVSSDLYIALADFPGQLPSLGAPEKK